MKIPARNSISSINRAPLWATHFALSLLAAASASASAIMWSAPQTISGDTDVSTDGTFVVAHNLGTGNSSPTINGVTFTQFATGGLSHTVGNVTLSAATPINGVNMGLGDILPPFSTLSADYQLLLDSGSFTASMTPPPATISLTLGGLTPGSQYQFQWWAHETIPTSFNPNFPAPGVPTTTATAGGIVTLNRADFAPGSVGQYAIGIFTADVTTSQTIMFDGSDTRSLLNGFQLRQIDPPAIPEPGSCLFGFALTGFLLSTASRRRGSTTAPSKS